MPNLSSFKTREEFNEYYRKYREKNRKKLRVYGQKYNKKWRQEHGYNTYNWYSRNKEKADAHRRVYLEVKSGRLKKEPCKVCGAKRVQAHHPDYSKPLKVVWLCPLHHKLEHRKLIHRKTI